MVNDSPLFMKGPIVKLIEDKLPLTDYKDLYRYLLKLEGV